MGVPLSSCSCHPKHTHDAWPAGEVVRIRRNSLHEREFEIYRSKFFARLQEHFLKLPVSRRNVQHCGMNDPCNNLSCEEPVSKVVLRIVVRYHPLIRHLRTALQGVLCHWNEVVQRRWGSPVQLDIQVGFAAAGRPLHSMLAF